MQKWKGKAFNVYLGLFVQSTMAGVTNVFKAESVPLIVQGKEHICEGSLPSVYQGNQIFGCPFPLSTKVTIHLGIAFLCLPR